MKYILLKKIDVHNFAFGSEAGVIGRYQQSMLAILFLICCWQIQKRCFSCSINSTKWLNEELALFHCGIYGMITYVMLPLVHFHMHAHMLAYNKIKQGDFSCRSRAFHRRYGTGLSEGGYWGGPI